MRTHRTTNFRATAITVSIVLASLATVACLHRPPLTWLMVGVDVAVCVVLFTNWTVTTRVRNKQLRGELTTRLSLVPFDSLPVAEQVHIAAVRPSLRVVRDEYPVADESCLAEITRPNGWADFDTESPIHDSLAVERFREQLRGWGSES
jgi:hypothetical protein